MKRIQRACQNPALRFDGREELAKYTAAIAQKGVPCRIYAKREQPDGEVPF